MGTLTEKAVRELAPRDKAYRVFDGDGLGMLVYPSGARAWFFRYTSPVDGVRRSPTIGQWPAIGIVQARSAARELRRQLDTGHDPHAPAQESAAVAYGTVSDLLDGWLAVRRADGMRTADKVASALREAAAALGTQREARGVTPADVRQLLARIIQRGSETQSNRMRSYLLAAWRWGIHHDNDPRTLGSGVTFGIERNPVDAIPRNPAAEHVGERVLSWDEVRTIWWARDVALPYRCALRLLLIYGTRSGEIIEGACSEWDAAAEVWTLPSERSKNGRDLLLPLVPAARAELLTLDDFYGDARAWLFPRRHQQHATQPADAARLSAAVATWHELRGSVVWTPRDLRRTWKTLTGAAGISKDIRDRIQNHALGDVSSRHYDRYAYLAEKRAALEIWCDELLRQVGDDHSRGAAYRLRPPRRLQRNIG